MFVCTHWIYCVLLGGRTVFIVRTVCVYILWRMVVAHSPCVVHMYVVMTPKQTGTIIYVRTHLGMCESV